ncbi:MAG: helix-turn-helix transcriptional regulator, partial [Actinomycetota bacterium]
MSETGTTTEGEILQAQARALGDPTRHAVFRQIADAPAPLGISDLAERFPFHHNAIRQHVAKLVAAGLVREERASARGPGRPRHVYLVDPSVAGRWGTTGPYERLSRLLARMLRSGDDARTVGRQAAAEEVAREARAAGHEVQAADVDAAVAALTEAMDRQGFAPEAKATRGGPELVLHHCPFESAALEDRETICALHLGIA